MSVSFSVIVCTHNPRPAYLVRTLAGLKAQTLDKVVWELILVDNASTERLSATWDLQWHAQGRHLREDALGLTAARICGIRAARGEVMIFVDDDNVLAPDFLAIAAKVAAEKTFLGCWGPGVIQPEYETPLPREIAPYESWWCVKNAARDAWANFDDERTMPAGAGLCLRREPALRIVEELIKDDAAMKLDRRGDALACAGDVFLCLKCLEYGWGSGIIKAMRLVHLIPPGRTTAAYVLGLAEGFGYSGVIMDKVFNRVPPRTGFFRQMIDLIRQFAGPPLIRRVAQARRQGQRRARVELARTNRE